MKTSFALAAALAVALATISPAALALGPLDVELAGIGGYATNELSAELGGRAGISVFGVYAGVRGEYFTGSSFELLGTPNSYHQYALGGEVGYGFKLRVPTGIANSNLVIRPLVGFGYSRYENVFHYPPAPAPPPNGDVTSHYTQPYLQPGVLVQLGLGPFIVGVEGSAYVPTTEASQSAFVLEGQVGVRL